MCVYICVYMCVYMWCVHVYVCVHVYINVHAYVYVHVYVCTCVCVCMCVCTCMNICRFQLIHVVYNCHSNHQLILIYHLMLSTESCPHPSYLPQNPQEFGKLFLCQWIVPIQTIIWTLLYYVLLLKETLNTLRHPLTNLMANQ